MTAVDDLETWNHYDCERHTAEIMLDGPDEPIGQKMRDSAGEWCIVTKAVDGRKWGVNMRAVAAWNTA